MELNSCLSHIISVAMKFLVLAYYFCLSIPGGMSEYSTGLQMNFTKPSVNRMAEGFEPEPILPYDEESENFFKNYRRTNKNRNRGLYPFKRTPSYYNAVEEGLVTPVQDQGVCLSCVAFATIAMLETCLAKKLGMYVTLETFI